MPNYFSAAYWKLSTAFTQPNVEFIISRNVMDCPFVRMNYPVWVLAHYPLRSLWWMQAAAASLRSWWYWCGGPRGLPAHCPPSCSFVGRVMLTVHSWQSVSSPPTTMRYPRCGEQGPCWLQLKPSRSRRTCCLWSFLFQRAQMLTLLYASETLQPSLPRKKKCKSAAACYRYGSSEIKKKERMN